MATPIMYGSQTEKQYKDLLARNQRRRAEKSFTGAVDLKKGLPFEVVNLNKATPAQATEYEKLSGTKINLPKPPVPAVSPTPLAPPPLEKPVSAGLTGLGDEVKNRALGIGEEKSETPEDKMIADLTAKLTAYATQPTLTEDKKRLEEEKGVAGMKTVVGSFEDEVIKTQNLLDSLESDITSRTKDYLVSESQRSRIYAAEQEPLMKSLGIAERGLTKATGRLERTQADILTELGLIEKEKTTPLELLEREVTIRSKIKELTDKNMPNVVKSEFNEEGDLTIVTQDEDGFHTQTMKGIGKKAEQYTSFRDVTDDSGNVTIMGIKKDGTVDKLGTFKGAGKTSTATVEKPLAPTEFNIKSGLVGFTQTQVNDIFKSTNPPKWFMDQAQKEYQMSFAGDKMSKLWKEYTDAMKKKAEGAASGGGSDWDNL